MSKYSFSKLDLFKQCKRKYKYRYIDKLSGDLILPALVKGKRVHSLLEHFGTDYKPDFKATKSELQEVYDIYNRFIKSDLGKEILAPKSVREFHIKFDSDLKPTILKPSFEGYIDRVNVGDSIELIDFKTGKFKESQNFDQLSIYATWFLQKYPKFKSVKLRYVYVEHLKENTMEFSDFEPIKANVLNMIKQIESESIFDRNITPLCDYCDFKSICFKSFNDSELETIRF